MALIKPFRGIRYNLEKAVLKQVISPPYDIISDKMRDTLEIKSPYNIVKLILPQGEDKYKHAKKVLDNWIKDGILLEDSKPCFYLYEQEYVFGNQKYNRTGFIGLVKLEELGKGSILPHEKTLSTPIEDRFNLLQEVKSNLSQVFSMYMDQEKKLERLFNYIKKSIPSASALDDEGVKNSIWLITDEKDIQYLVDFMKNKKLYIADGHHRYSTALTYRNIRRSEDGVSENELRDYDYIMMMMVNFYDDGLKVFPTHRIINIGDGFNEKEFFKCINKNFDIVEDIKDIQSFLSDSTVIRFILYIGEKCSGLVLKDESLEKLHPVYRKVNTYVLHELILKNCLNYNENELSKGHKITYVHTVEEVHNATNKFKTMAFILPPVDLNIIREIAENNLYMPQKSTYFYPKLASGLVIYKFE
jgi:uncharacterized protein (DUF1015 family)